MEHDPTHTQPLRLKKGRLGGLKHLERLLGLREAGGLPIDAVFVSLDLEVASDRQRLHLSTTKPVATQLAFASLDTRHIHSLSGSSDLRSLISVQMFEVDLPPTSKKAAREKEKGQQCIFAQTHLITSQEVFTTITQNLRITDSLAGTENSHLRNIVLVGHSLGEDLRILRLLGIDLASVGPILTIIDTHSISRYLFPPYRPDRAPGPGQDFSLAGVLAKFGCVPPRSEFHNAGNDAVYSLYAMLLLAIKEGIAREAKLSTSEFRNLETIRRSVSDTLGIYDHLQEPELNRTSPLASD